VANGDTTLRNYYKLPSPGVTYADLDCRLSIVDNIANFKVPLIDGAEIVSTVLNNSKIQFRRLPVILIMFGRKRYMLLRIYVGLSMSVTLKSLSRSIPDNQQGGLSFLDVPFIYTHSEDGSIN
jgi:hypothetical protein